MDKIGVPLRLKAYNVNDRDPQALEVIVQSEDVQYISTHKDSRGVVYTRLHYREYNVDVLDTPDEITAQEVDLLNKRLDFAWRTKMQAAFGLAESADGKNAVPTEGE